MVPALPGTVNVTYSLGFAGSQKNACPPLGPKEVPVTCPVLLIPLTMKQIRSMQAMQRLQPEIKRLQQKYKDDRQKLNEETMKFYKENGVNPLAGCLPMIPQMIVFFALFSVLRAIADWTPGHIPQYGLTVPVVEGPPLGEATGAVLTASPSLRPAGRANPLPRNP